MLWTNLRNSKNSALTAAAFIVLAWTLFHLIFYRQFIFHDAWQHVFPITFSISSQSSCANPTSWLGSVDNGSSSAIYLISMSLTQLLQLPFIAYVSCLKPTIVSGIYGFKIEIMTAYAVFSFGMFLMGLQLFQRKLSAVYLFVITLFSGICLDNLHSSQIIAIIFWLPWIILSFLLFNKEENSTQKSIWLNGCILLICAQLLDQYPHFLVIFLFFSILFFIAPNRSALRRLASVNLLHLIPSLIFISLTIIQLWIIRTTVDAYQPSLRSSLTVSPEQFGETGFLQFTAFLSTFFPLTLLSNYDVFANGMGKLAPLLGATPGARLFIYKLDSLLLIVGILPVIFCFFYIFGQRIKVSKKYQILLFIGAMALIAIQQFKVYYLLVHVPFFNIFRSYFLFTPFLVISLLVLSAFGFDHFLNSNTKERQSTGKKALSATFLLIAISASTLLVIWNLGATPESKLKPTFFGLLADCLIICLSILTFWKSCKAKPGNKLILQLISVYLFTQLFSLSGTYYFTGENIDSLLMRYDSGKKDFIKNSANTNDAFVKSGCTYFASCYLSPSPTASLNTDLNGTFLRNKSEPLFYIKKIGLNQAKQLMGVEYQSIWIDSSFIPVLSYEEVAAALHNKMASPKKEMPNYIHTKDNPPNTKSDYPNLSARIVKWSPEKIEIAYIAPIDSYIFLPINFDNKWKAEKGDKSLSIFAANLGGLAINAPASTGENIVLFRQDLEVNFLWASRIALILFAGCFLIFISRICMKKINN